MSKINFIPFPPSNSNCSWLSPLSWRQYHFWNQLGFRPESSASSICCQASPLPCLPSFPSPLATIVHTSSLVSLSSNLPQAHTPRLASEPFRILSMPTSSIQSCQYRGRSDLMRDLYASNHYSHYSPVMPHTFPSALISPVRLSNMRSPQISYLRPPSGNSSIPAGPDLSLCPLKSHKDYSNLHLFSATPGW